MPSPLQALWTFFRRRLIHRSAGWYYWFAFRHWRRLFLANLDTSRPFTKTTQDSAEIYEADTDRELQHFETGSDTVVLGDDIARMSNREVRRVRLQPAIELLERVRVGGKRLRVLEVGCGNAINLAMLGERYEQDFEFHGVDIAANRIKLGREHFGDRLGTISLLQASITQQTPWPDEYFDIVFSVHALEQISYRCEDALREMYRLCRQFIVMVEPVFEFANPTQRLQLIMKDHNRILLKTVTELGYSIEKQCPLKLQPLQNQSSVVVIAKRGIELPP